MKTFGKILLLFIASFGVLQAMKKCTGEQYAEEHYGHKKEHLEALIALQKRSLNKNIIYFAGDSALDNKYWLKNKAERQPAVNDLDKFFEDNKCIPDVEYWLNYYLDSAKQNFAAVNTAVEEARIYDYKDKTSSQKAEVKMTSELIRNNITQNDYLVVNVGGNDVLLANEPRKKEEFKKLFSSNQAEKEAAMKFFVNFIRDDTQAMISAELVSEQKPKGVVICTFYMPSWDADASSWSETVKLLDGKEEEFLSFAQKIHTEAVSQIRITGTQIIPLPLYEHLTGKDFGDYVDRVEPSSQGGKKMAKAIYDKIFIQQKQDKNAKKNQGKPSKTSKNTGENLRPESLNPKNNSISRLNASFLVGGLMLFLF